MNQAITTTTTFCTQTKCAAQPFSCIFKRTLFEMHTPPTAQPHSTQRQTVTKPSGFHLCLRPPRHNPTCLPFVGVCPPQHEHTPQCVIRLTTTTQHDQQHKTEWFLAVLAPPTACSHLFALRGSLPIYLLGLLCYTSISAGYNMCRVVQNRMYTVYAPYIW